MGLHADLREKLISDYATLSPQMQKAARYILDHPNDVDLRSMRALAREADVPPSTISRACCCAGRALWAKGPAADSHSRRTTCGL